VTLADRPPSTVEYLDELACSPGRCCRSRERTRDLHAGILDP